MAITAPVLGGTTMAQVGHRDSYNETLELRGGDIITANGTMLTDLVQASAKRKFELKWVGLTEAQVSTIETAWATVATASVSFTSPRGGTYTVTRDTGAMALDIRLYGSGAGVVRGDVSMRLREV